MMSAFAVAIGGKAAILNLVLPRFRSEADFIGTLLPAGAGKLMQ
jgi:hypothetical protein